MQITDRILSPKANNFTVLRLILASAVIYTHSVFWVLHLEETDDFSRFLGQPISYYAVDGFFFLSGFLVYPSLTRLGTALEFAKARLTQPFARAQFGDCLGNNFTFRRIAPRPKRFLKKPPIFVP